ncbi:hypothetical protein GDO81_021475 [Engystomops pustulosus]|uniref:Uncharacterized protein n=1 Tax=Engystomops pustulosus TaxID=76066 RepID=A0AAV6ZCL5_ENGPU|nr:hypothetical protein GDO81_021475 [Engystomops pustulosus]
MDSCVSMVTDYKQTLCSHMLLSYITLFYLPHCPILLLVFRGTDVNRLTMNRTEYGKIMYNSLLLNHLLILTQQNLHIKKQENLCPSNM